MQVTVVYFDGCPNWHEAARRLRGALDRCGHQGTRVSFVPVATEDEAAAAGFRGSPTILIDGADLFPGSPAPGGLSCRVYSAGAGLAGVPDLADLTAALESRLSR
jgi:hypothetical protein